MLVSAGSIEHAGDVLVGQLALERLEVVDLDHAGRQDRIDGRADAAVAGDGLTVGTDLDHGLVDRAVVAVVVDEDLGPAADLAAEPDEEAVGVGRGDAELPVPQAEAPGHQLADGAGVLARQHRRHPALQLRVDRGDRRARGVAAHRPGVAEAEVDVGVAVDVGDLGALRLADVDGEATGPARHPVHRHPREQILGGAFVHLARAGVGGLEALLLPAQQRFDQLRRDIFSHLPTSSPFCAIVELWNNLPRPRRLIPKCHPPTLPTRRSACAPYP